MLIDNHYGYTVAVHKNILLIKRLNLPVHTRHPRHHNEVVKISIIYDAICIIYS